jgi:hypothetical protein
MVRLGGLEPPTSGSTIRRSNQLSYNRTRKHLFERRANYAFGAFFASRLCMHG